MNNKKYRILDLFCGAGGFSFGLDSLNEFETKIGLDFDKNAIKTFERMFPEAEAICGDITSDKLKNYIIEKSKNLKINMIIGGPPCQGFSLKGKNLGIRDDRNFLFREYAYIVEKVNPEIFVIENVKNMISYHNPYF
jgi:DNA-cytosine methyltransferase